MRTLALRYLMAPVFVAAAALLHLSIAGPTLHPTGLFMLAVLAAAWFGGVGPGFLAAVLATFTLPRLVGMNYPLLGGFLDTPRFITFSLAGLLVGWWSFRRRQVEEALRDSERRYALVIEASDQAFWDWIPAGDKLYFSPMLLQLFGFPPGTTFATRAEFYERLPILPNDRVGLMQAIADHFAGKTDRMEYEYRAVVRGEVRWFHAVGRATFDAGGKVVRWSGAVRDVTEKRRVDEALRESEGRYALAMEAAGDGHTDWDLITGEHYISPRLLQILGYPPGTTFADRAEWVRRFPFYPDDRPKWERAIAAHFAGRDPHFKMELRIVVGGEVRWTVFHFLSTRDENGTPIRWTGSVGDITEQKLAQEAVRVSEDRFARAVAGSSDGVWDIDLAGGSVYFSPRTRELCGLPPGPEVVPLEGWFEKIPLHPEDLPKRMALVKEHVEGKTPAYDGEFRFLQPDGVYRWRHLHGVAVRDANGKPLRMAGSMSDVDARRRAEDALRKSEQRYELAMAASESGYWDWDIAADQYFASPRAYELAGFPQGTTWATRNEYSAAINMHPEDLAKWEAAREALFSGTGERLSMEVRYIVRGETRWHILHAICRRDETGAVVRWTGSSTNITERKRAEQALLESERKLRQAQRLESMGTLAGGIAHDFNNILGAILGYGEMAQRGAPKGSRLARDLDNIMLAGERGRALVDRVLAFSRSAVGERVPVHVEAVVREVLDQVMARVPPNVAVLPKLRAGRAAILGDATQVHQVVANLMSNAIQAMPDGGMLRLELAAERVDTYRSATIGGLAAGEYVVLTVSDSGTGIAPEIADRIFDPFFTTKEVGTGTGLGLALVHGIVIDLGGAIDVVSRPGAGATFVVYLPRSGQAPEAADDAAQELPRGEGQRVLVVDDEEPLMQLATRTLEELGYAPTGFTSSSAALAAFRADPQRFDALVTDERMPGMSGSTLINEVRGIRGSIRVVLMSGYLGTAATQEADEVLQKPLSARALAASLARVLAIEA